MVENSAEVNLWEVDLTDIRHIDFVYVPTSEAQVTGKISLFADRKGGTLIASGNIEGNSEPMKPSGVRMNVAPEMRKKLENVWFVVEVGENGAPIAIIQMNMDL